MNKSELPRPEFPYDYEARFGNVIKTVVEATQQAFIDAGWKPPE